MSYWNKFSFECPAVMQEVKAVPAPNSNLTKISPLYQAIHNYVNIEEKLDIFACKLADIKGL